MRQSQQNSSAFPIGAVCSVSTLFAFYISFVSNVRQLFAADDFSGQHFQMHFFLGTLRVNNSTAWHFLLPDWFLKYLLLITIFAVITPHILIKAHLKIVQWALTSSSLANGQNLWLSICFVPLTGDWPTVT